MLMHAMSTARTDFSQFHRLEQAVRLLATSPDSPRKKVELAFTSFLLPIVPSIRDGRRGDKLSEALALATKFPPLIEGEGNIRGTMRRVQFSTLEKIMTLIFDAHLESRREIAASDGTTKV